MQVGAPQPAALNAYSPASGGTAVAGPLPTNTTPSATDGGEANPDSKLIPVHLGSQRGLPHPAAGYAATTPRLFGSGEACVVANTVRPETAGAPSAPPSPVS